MLIQILLVLYCGLLLAGAVQDVISLRISNLISVAVLVVAVAALILNPGPVWWQHPLSFVIALGLGAGLFAMRWLGGGDAKLLAAAAMAFDLGGLARLLVSVCLVGGVLALVVMLVRLVMGGKKALKERRGLPYGVAIAAGAFVAAWLFSPLTVFTDRDAAAAREFFQDSDFWNRQQGR